ncbi:MAG: hypothetical protein VCA55_04990 [Verrucomicrobiales bacterium]
MKFTPHLVAAILVAHSVTALAQNARRPLGGGGSFGGGGLVKPAPPRQAITRTITYLALTKERQWLNTGGKSIFATLVAFDTGDKAKSIPPTIIKSGKIRLLKGKKAFQLPLETLDPQHRADVVSIQTQIASLYQKNPAVALRPSGTKSGVPTHAGPKHDPISGVKPALPLNSPPTKAYKPPTPPPRLLTPAEIKRHSSQLGPRPKKTGSGYPAMLLSIQKGEVTSIKVSKIKQWGPLRAHLWNGKPYWSATVTYPDASSFGVLDTEAMAMITGDRVIKWLYSSSGEDVP